MRSLMRNLGIHHPIIQAPMAGVTTPEFVATSSEAGILGSIGAGYLSAEETRNFIREVKKRTTRPFAVNLFVPENRQPTEEQLQQAEEALRPIREELGLNSSTIQYAIHEFEEQIQVLIDEDVKICSFTFGLPDEKTVQLLKEHNVFLIGTATTAEEASVVEQAGLDAVVAQGSEAGGHRGSFEEPLKFIPLTELLAAVVASVNIPVIAAGGIANREMVDQALSRGAQAVQIGTALLAAHESGAHPLYKEAILSAQQGSTVLTTAFSGKAARGIRNRFMDEMKDAAIAPYPYQNDMTKELRKQAVIQGKPEFMSLWAGENVHLSNEGKLTEIIKQLI